MICSLILELCLCECWGLKTKMCPSEKIYPCFYHTLCGVTSLGSLSIKLLVWGFSDHPGSVNSGCKPEMSCSSKFSVVSCFSFIAFSQHQSEKSFLFSYLSSDWGWEAAGLFLVHFESEDTALWDTCCGLSILMGPGIFLPSPTPHSCENRGSTSSGSTNDLSSWTEILLFLWSSLMDLRWWFSYILDKNCNCL